MGANTKRRMEHHWNNIKRQMENKWRKAKGFLEDKLRMAKEKLQAWKRDLKRVRKDLDEAVKEIKFVMKVARPLMRKSNYYWKMFKEMRQFIGDYKPNPPNRLLEPFEELNE